MLSPKIHTHIDDAIQVINRWKDMGYEVVFTNGCFDILHPGHIHTLSKASSYGDKLIVGLNSDASIKRLKGLSRPINNTESRAIVLSALEMVDMVVVFDEDTPAELLQVAIPDVLIKGGDYKLDEIVGADIIHEHGGRVEIIPFLKGHSTTSIIKKLKKLEK